jgi:GAF domain
LTELEHDRSLDGGVGEELERERARAEEAEGRAIAAAPPLQATAADSRPHWSSAAQRTLASTLASASEWRTGVRDVVKVLGYEAGWDAVCAWLPDDRGRLLRCAAMWTAGPDDRDEFETRTWQKPDSIHTSELGRAFAGRDATRLTEIGAAEDERLLAASHEGMRSAVLVPVHSGRMAVGVLELLSRQELGPDAELVAAMDAVAVQLGHFWQLLRQAAEPHWRLGRL